MRQVAQDFVPVSRPSLTERERELLLKAFDSSWISSSGPYIEEFEQRFAELCHCEHAIAVANGTVALHLALLATGVQAGDEVIVPSLTYIATANAVTYCGATPVFADIDSRDWGLSEESVRSVISPKTRAIIAVHLYGYPANMTMLRKVCMEHDLRLIEDAAEAPFAVRDGQTVGSIGDVATFSFYGNKVITSGEGGAVTTDDPDLATRLRTLRGQGMDPDRRYWFPVVGFNYRLTNVASAILCGQLDRLDEILAERRRIYRQYDLELAKCVGISTGPETPECTTTPWLYPAIVTNPELREPLMAHLTETGIESRPFFIPVHSLPPYLHHPRANDLGVTDRLGASGVSLPTFPDLTTRDVARIGTEVRAFLDCYDGSIRSRPHQVPTDPS